MSASAPGMADVAAPQVRVEGDVAILDGDWTLRGLSGDISRLRARLESCARRQELGWDLSRVRNMDNAGALLLWQAWGRELPERLELREAQRALLDTWLNRRPPEGYRRRIPLDERIERMVVEPARAGLGHLREGLTLLGELVLDVGHLIRHPGGIPWREISATIYLAGTRAIPIMGLLAVLTGVVFSYQAAVQLRAFGADMLIVDMLAFAMVRELGPLMTAILVAGRSGSSMTAQIGVMRVTEELDAMKVLGIPISRRLLLPRVLGLIVVLPLLTLWTIIIALIGGGLTAQMVLDVGIWHLMDALPTALPAINLAIGMGKAAVFGLIIGLTASHFGMRIKPNTRSLASETTRSVVAALTLVVVMNGLFTIGLQDVGFKSS